MQLKKKSLLSTLVIIISLMIIMASTDSNAVGQGEVTLYLNKKILFFSIFDVLLIFLIFTILMTEGRFYYGSQKLTLLTIIVTIIFLNFLGFTIGRFGDFRVTSLLGPEVRGLFSFALSTYIFYWLLSKSRIALPLLINTIILFVIIRSLYELFFLQGAFYFENSRILDMSQLIFIATFAVLMMGLVVSFNSKIRNAYSLLLILFVIMVFLGFRRTAMIITFGGIITTSLFIIISQKSSFNKIFIVLISLFTLSFSAIYIDKMIFDGKYSERIVSVVDFDAVEGTSNYEHLADANDALNVIRNHPITGAGLGTTIPGRILANYGEDIPFHSPHLHSWVKFGIFGLIAYLSLNFWAIKSAFFFNRTRLNLININSASIWGFAASIALSCYLLFAIKMPPFYLDQKITFMAGLLMGVIIYCRQQVECEMNNHKLGRA